MSRKYKIRDQEKLYFATFTIVEWIDLFSRRDYRDIFLDSLKFCQKNKGLELCAYCVMSSHVHLIIGRNGDAKLEDLIRDIKKFTSVKFLEAIKTLPDESRREFPFSIPSFKGLVSLHFSSPTTVFVGENGSGKSTLLKVLESRIQPEGIYLIDEPEAALSPQRQLALFSLIKNMATNQNCQFIIATHSPILMSLPDAQILQVEDQVHEVKVEETEHYMIMKNFLNNPGAFLRFL